MKALNPKTWRNLFVVAALVLFSFSALAQTDQMQVHFINVGQADAALLEFPCGAILIDAGSENAATEQHLVDYLKAFFARRADLNNTIDLMVLSHDHIDHDYALKAVAQTFHIKNFIDNGHTKGSGQVNQGWMEKYMASSGGGYESISYDQLTANGHNSGKTDNIIEPLHCSVTTPQITVLSGRFESMPGGWANADFTNENNHSLVVRVQYGKASFLFTGDLETAGDHILEQEYGSTGLLQADVWKVSHHGAVNGTNAKWVSDIRPKYAVISCGQWFDGANTNGMFNTYHYGHPRVSTLNFLSASIAGNRPVIDTPVVAFTGTKTQNVRVNVTKNIYCTAWDGDITIKATPDGVYTVITKDQ